MLAIANIGYYCMECGHHMITEGQKYGQYVLPPHKHITEVTIACLNKECQEYNKNYLMPRVWLERQPREHGKKEDIREDS